MERLPPYPIQSVDNALRLLLIVHRDGVLRLSAAAEELHVAKSTAHRLLAMLCYRGFVAQDAERAYVPGAALAGGTGHVPISLTGVCRPYLERLSEEVQETVHLVTLHGAEIRFADSVEGQQVLRVGSRVGVVLPAMHTSGGRVLLAELPRADLKRLFPQYPPESDEMLKLLRTLSTTRRRRYGTNFEETEAGVTAIGVAVRDADGRAVAAVTVSAPTIRYRRGQIVNVLPAVQTATDAIRSDLIGRR